MAYVKVNVRVLVSREIELLITKALKLCSLLKGITVLPATHTSYGRKGRARLGTILLQRITKR